MQLPKRIEINERQCPVPDTVFAKLHKSNPADAALIASTLPEEQRAQLAAFCYKRMHLSHLAIMIASSCSRQVLVSAMGTPGELLFEQSRDPQRAIEELRASTGDAARKGISLASFGGKSRLADIDDANENIVPLRNQA